MTTNVLVSMYSPPSLAGSMVTTKNGGSYAVDTNGYVTNVKAQDVSDLAMAGFVQAPATVDRADQFMGKLIGANFNVTTDQFITLSLFGLAPVGTKVYPSKIIVTNASIPLTTAAGGVYSAAAKGGTAIVASSQAYSSLTSASIALELTIAAKLAGVTLGVYLSLTTAQGAAATADVYVFGTVLG